MDEAVRTTASSISEGRMKESVTGYKGKKRKALKKMVKGASC